MSDIKKEKIVKAVDNVKVYSTKKVSAFYPTVGTEMIVHSEQAKKLIAAGKATKEAPKGGKAPLEEETEVDPVDETGK